MFEQVLLSTTNALVHMPAWPFTVMLSVEFDAAVHIVVHGQSFDQCVVFKKLLHQARRQDFQDGGLVQALPKAGTEACSVDPIRVKCRKKNFTVIFQ